MSCDFCKANETRILRKIKDDGVLKVSGYTFLKGKNLYYQFIYGDISCQSVQDSYEIEYCPYCGQKLNDNGYYDEETDVEE